MCDVYSGKSASEIEHSGSQISKSAIDDTGFEIIRESIQKILEVLAPDDMEVIENTPTRVAKFYQDMFQSDDNMDGTFKSIEVDQLVMVKDVRVWSLCEHHLMPFWVDISMGYLSKDRVLGLSKFARIAHHYAGQLQIQERLIHQIAKHLERVTGSPDVAVVGQGVHTCMVMRGIKTDGVMLSSYMGGAFRDNADLRKEFLMLSK